MHKDFVKLKNTTNSGVVSTERGGTLMAEIYTVPQVAELLALDVKTIQKYLRDGKLHGHKIGNYWRITKEEVNELLDETRN